MTSLLDLDLAKIRAENDRVHAKKRAGGGSIWLFWNWEFCRNYKRDTGFYSEVSDALIISSNRRTLLFSWAWILKLWDFKGLKACHISVGSCSEASNKAPFYYLSLQSWFRLLNIWHDLSPLKYLKFKIQAQENNKVRLFEEMTNASVPSE